MYNMADPGTFDTDRKDATVNLEELVGHYDFSGNVVAITGGAGALCGEMAAALSGCGARIAILDRETAGAERLAEDRGIRKDRVLILQADVLDRVSLEDAARRIDEAWGGADCLINGAGGNRPDATTGSLSFFDLPIPAIRSVSDLNLLGTILPSQVFGSRMARKGKGVILNVSSMNAFRPLTRIPAYSAAKAAVSNFTQWLAVHMAREYSPDIRVNALAPGFFLTEQNRYLLKDPDTGEWTPRGKQILEHTPMGRFGAPGDLTGAVLWLLSPMSRFVTGIVIPVDGGFSAYSGV
jgi:NAD(P)-dependent dehydrogenase (short-subunit alcohol dehydrogenase family)